MGIRPLFYARAGNDWVFGSEVKAIFAHHGVTRKIDPVALDDIYSDFTCGYGDIAEAFPKVIWHTETPILRTAPVPLFLLSRLVRDNSLQILDQLFLRDLDPGEEIPEGTPC